MTKSDAAPTGQAIRERALSLATQAMFAVALECRRIRTDEPEDNEFIFRRWFEMQYLVLSLIRLQSAARAFRKAKGVRIDNALDTFKAALPGLRELRDVAEHIDEYAVDSSKRKHKHIKRRMLAVGSWDGSTIEWLGGSLNIDAALLAARTLFSCMQAETKRLVKSNKATA